MLLKKMPFLLLFIIIAVVCCDAFIPLHVKAIFFALSLTIKSIIIFLLPMIIFGLLFKVMANLARQATILILFLFVGVLCSNFISTWISHYVGIFLYQLDLMLVIPQEIKGLEPAWLFEFPKIIANDKAMFAGVVIGLITSLTKQKLAVLLSGIFEKIINKLLKLMTYMMPIFVGGFVMKLHHDGVMATIVKDYAFIFMIIALAQGLYVSCFYLVASRFNARVFLSSIKNMLPAMITGFSTMSSAAAMPLTIIGAEKNARSPDFARSIIPATVNIHLIGDCFAIPIFAYAVMKNYGLPLPSEFSYLVFSLYFVLAKFSVAAVPGGGILVMLPILENYLGFHAEMLSLITALYILFDPVITCVNVLGNGGFALLIDSMRKV